MSQPAISIIIPHLNQPDFLARCLASLLAQTDTPDFEILVVDNGSASLPEEVCAVDPRVRLFSQPVPGPGPARNLGAAKASAPILAFIDADCTAEPGWLARITATFAADPDKAILGGDVFIAREGARATLLEAYESVYAYRMKEYIAKQGFTGTGNLAVRAAVMAEVGEFAGIGIAEDRDWGQRATAMGHATHYVDGMVVYHPARKTFQEMREKWARHVAHDCEEIRSKSGWQMRWIARAALVAGSPLGEIAYILRSPRISGLRERALAFWGVIRVRMYRARLMLGFLFSDPTEASGAWNRG